MKIKLAQNGVVLIGDIYVKCDIKFLPRCPLNDKEQMTLSEIQPKLEGEAVLLAKKLEGLLISRFADNDKEEI